MQICVYAFMLQKKPKLRYFLAFADFCMCLSRLCLHVILCLSRFELILVIDCDAEPIEIYLNLIYTKQRSNFHARANDHYV